MDQHSVYSPADLRFEIIIVLAIGHLDEGIDEVCLPGLLLHKPDLVKALPTDATAQVSMKLDGQTDSRWSANSP